MQIGVCFVLLIGLLGILTRKYAPLLLHTTIFYCQEIIKSINIGNLPQNSNLVFVIPVFLILFFIALRLGVTIVQLLFIARNLNQQKIAYHSLPFDKLIRKLHLTGKVAVVNNNQPLALCYGLLNSKIYISTGLIKLSSRQELEVILKHEKHHLIHNDNRTILCAHVIEKTFPLLPLLADLVRNFRIEREIAADRYAADGEKHQFVATVLKKLLKHPQPAFAYFPSLAAADTLEARIESLFFKKKFTSTYSAKNISISICSILMLLGLTLTPVHAIELHTKGQDAIMVCVNNEQCAVQCKTNLQEMQRMTPVSTMSTPYTPATGL